ncbi:unnamed protein product [Phytophthora fragariaefolia]|uniref:Unnamed protein product n=1 Tax=Phytophthora fragariaefolia TaxID=1490495 RepID=A0A9W6Y8B6_9STRA|nr:unnamed protein product [Phytophthora fragariaefolia]
MIYQRMIDNALWGFVQPRGGWSAFAERVRMAEAADAAAGGSPTDTAIHGRTRFEEDRETSDIPDSLSAVVNDPRGDMFVSGEADQSSLVPVFGRRSFVDDICFGGESFDSCLETLDRLLSRFEECRISVSFTKSMFVQPTVDFLSHAVSREGLRADAKKLKAIAELSFPKTKKGVQAFLGALNYYSRFKALQTKVADAPILKHFNGAKEVHVMLFANDWALSTTLMQEHDGVMHPVRFCGRVLKDNEVNYHPAGKEVLALLLLLKTCYTQLAGRTIHAYTRFSTLGWINTSKTLFGRSTQFAVMLSLLHLVVHRVTEDMSSTSRWTGHPSRAQGKTVFLADTITKDPANSADTAQWRREASRQREIALQLAKEYQLAEKARRAEAHNARLSGKEKRSLPESTQLARERSTENEDADSEVDPAESQRSLFELVAKSGCSWSELDRAEEEDGSPMARPVQGEEEGGGVRL